LLTATGERIVPVSKPLDAQLKPKRQIERDEASRSHGLRMPPRRYSILDRQTTVVDSLLPGLAPTVPALARFVLWDANRPAVPVHPRCLEMCDFASPKPESSCDETDEPCFEIVWRREACARFQQQFELPVSEYILVRVPSCERPPMAICPFSCGLVVVRHP
jgi:hypothetical protein